MTVLKHRTVAATLLVCVATATGLAVGTAGAQAAPAVSGSFTMTGEPGDYIAGDTTYSYDVAGGDQLNISSDESHRGVSLSIDGKQGDWWSMDLVAPAGKQLAVGTYQNANRAPFNGTGPGLDVSGNGRGCNTLTGSFRIADVAFGPHGYVERLDATFEQHCEGGAAALRGRVVIDNPPPAPELTYTVSTATDGLFSKLNGKAQVHGTVVCNEDAIVNFSGLVTQVKNKVIIRGPFTANAACVKGQTATWAALADPTGTTPFQKGKAEVTGNAWASDPNYSGETVTADLKTTTVTLTKAPAAIAARMK
jgi:hypothetical protein